MKNSDERITAWDGCHTEPLYLEAECYFDGEIPTPVTDLIESHRRLTAEDSRKDIALQYIRMQCEQELETPCDKPMLFAQHILEQTTVSGSPTPADQIELYCIKCESRKTVDRQEDDPANAMLAHIQCPECVGGDFDSTEYFDKNGSKIPYESTADSSPAPTTCKHGNLVGKNHRCTKCRPLH